MYHPLLIEVNHVLKLMGQGGNQRTRPIVGCIPTRAFTLRQERRVHVEQQTFIGCSRNVGILQEVVLGPEVARAARGSALHVRTVSVDIVHQNVNVVSVLRGDQIRVVVRPPRTAEYGGQPIMDVVARPGAEKPVRERLDHDLTDTFRACPPLVVGYPHDQRRRAVGHYLAGSGRDFDYVLEIVKRAEDEAFPHLD